MNRLAEWVAAAAITAALIYGYQWYTKPASVPAGMTVIADPAPEVSKETKVAVVAKAPIKVYKPSAKAKLKLQDAAIWDKDTHVIASSKTANDDRPHTITTTLNTATGETTTYDRTDPLPWLAVSNRGNAGISYGVKDGVMTTRLQVHQEVLRIKALSFGATASADFASGSTQSFIGIEVLARW